MILEEHVTVEEKIKVEQFAYDFYQQMLQLEEFYKRKFNWTHWSDTSSMDVYRATVDAYDSGLVAKATNGRVELQGADKPRGSVETGIKMIRRLIRENRLFVGENCPWAIRMFQNIEHGTEKPVDDGKWKHIFDAIRYVIYMEERKEANYDERPMSRGVFSV